MKRYARLTFPAPALSIMLALGAAACGSKAPTGDGGERRSPGALKEITPGEYERLVGGAPSVEDRGDAAGPPRGKHRFHEGGELAGAGAKDSFVIVAAHQEVAVTFVWPRGAADFGVKVYGKDENLLGDFELDRGEVIRLTGGGRFRLEVYSKAGGGRWTATYDD